MNIRTKIRINSYLKTIALILSSLWLFNGCTTDFDVTEDFKDIPVIYGLMEYQDSFYLDNTNILKSERKGSVQFFKIGRTFLNDGGNALSAAQIKDSLYYGDELKAYLEEKENGALKNRYELIRIENNNKPSGIFSAPAQVLYKTPDGFNINPNALYYITTENSKTGVVATSQTDVLDKTELWRGLTQWNYIGFRKNVNLNIQWFSGKRVAFYDLKVIIHVKEWKINDTAQSTIKKMDWVLGTYIKTASLRGGESLQTIMQSGDFYNFLANSLTKDNTLKRKLLGVEFVFDGGGEEIYQYINVNRPAIGVVQKTNTYTNIQNGYGIFSSRSRTRIFKILDETTITDIISTYPTNELGFIR